MILSQRLIVKLVKLSHREKNTHFDNHGIFHKILQMIGCLANPLLTRMLIVLERNKT